MSDCLDAIQRAIVTAYQGNATLAAAGGPFLDMAVEGQTLPYCVYTVMPNSNIGLFFDGTYDEIFLIRFVLWHTNPTLLTPLRAALRATFDRAKLATASPVLCLASLPVEDYVRYVGANIDGNGTPGYQSITSYRFWTASA